MKSFRRIEWNSKTNWSELKRVLPSLNVTADILRNEKLRRHSRWIVLDVVRVRPMNATRTGPRTLQNDFPTEFIGSAVQHRMNAPL